MNPRYLFLRLGAQFIRSRFAWLLLPLSWIWSAVSWFCHFLYDVGFLRVHKVDIPVISVGNLAVGGTGKTPLVIQLAHSLGHKKVAILLRGYGHDEEQILRRHLPHATVYADPDRVKSAQLAVAEGAEVILLDDGFQHRRLHRDVDLVLIRRADFLGRCLPAGDLRESPRRLQKADLLVWDTEIRVKARRILTLEGQEIPSIQGEKVGMFCGIGSPHKFKKTLLDLGAVITAEWLLADHEPAREPALQAYYNRCKSLGVKWLVCTEKDAVKLSPGPLPILYVEIEVEVLGLEKLMAKIEERMYNGTQYGR